jgi:hypothetical protein
MEAALYELDAGLYAVSLLPPKLLSTVPSTEQAEAFILRTVGKGERVHFLDCDKLCFSPMKYAARYMKQKRDRSDSNRSFATGIKVQDSLDGSSMFRDSMNGGDSSKYAMHV